MHYLAARSRRTHVLAEEGGWDKSGVDRRYSAQVRDKMASGLQEKQHSKLVLEGVVQVDR